MKEVKDSLQNEPTALPGALKEAKAVEEKDVLLREALEEAAQESQLRGMEVKVRELLKTELEWLQGIVEEIKDVTEEALGGMERKVLSSPKMEDLGKDEGLVSEELTLPLLKACPVVVKKIKR